MEFNSLEVPWQTDHWMKLGQPREEVRDIAQLSRWQEPTTRALVTALSAGLAMIRCGFTPRATRRQPISGAFLRPRLFSGRSVYPIVDLSNWTWRGAVNKAFLKPLWFTVLDLSG